MSSIGYYDQSYPPSLWAPVVNPATGVTPGTPGYFTPGECDIPFNITELRALGPLGQTTAWTTNQFVVLGNASVAYWNGTGWLTGHAPLTQTESTTTTFAAIPVDNPPDTSSEEPSA